MVAVPSLIVTVEYDPTETSFMSSSVCRPLKRAKSTVGEPLRRETVFVPSEAVMFCTWTANEVTLCTGASVPTKNVEPVAACGLTVVDDWDPPPHPAARNEATVKARTVGRALLPDLSMDIIRFTAF